MSIAEAKQELAKYVGIQKCQTCGWKFDNDITDYCGCVREGRTPEGRAKHQAAYLRARELQAMVKQEK